MNKPVSRPKASPLLWLLPLLGILAGAAVAYATATRYEPPPAADEARLRERAAEYYKAGRLFDYVRIARLFTPAWQMEGGEKIDRQVAQFSGRFAKFEPATQAELKAAAETIEGRGLEVQLDGDWAQTGGVYRHTVEGQEVELPLDDIVWVRTAGDWWIYQLENPEILRYGLPPEPIRQALLMPGESMLMNDLPEDLSEVPVMGEDRYDPENALTAEEAAELRRKLDEEQKESESQQPVGDADESGDAGAETEGAR